MKVTSWIHQLSRVLKVDAACFVYDVSQDRTEQASVSVSSLCLEILCVLAESCDRVHLER